MKHIAISHLLIGVLALTVYGRQTAQQSTDKTPSLAKCEPDEGPPQPAPAVKRIGKAKIPCDIRSWAGEWQTNWGVMKLHFDDEAFSGNYGPSAHAVRGRFDAKSPCVLRGRWQHTNSQWTGRFTFCMTGLGSFTGNWSSGNADPDVAGSPWHGTRLLDPAVVLPKKITLAQLELEQAKHRAKLNSEYRTAYREMLNAQITTIIEFQKKYLKQGDRQKAMDAARMLAKLRRFIGSLPFEETKMLPEEAPLDGPGLEIPAEEAPPDGPGPEIPAEEAPPDGPGLEIPAEAAPPDGPALKKPTEEAPLQPAPAVKRIGEAKIPCDIRSWSGVWQTSYGMMKLHFDDEAFSGNYGPLVHAVRGRFDAKSPCVLRGRWQHTNSQSTGRFTFRMVGPGKFTGNWSSGNADPDVSGIGWHGTRAIAPAVVLPKKITLIQLELEQAKHRAKLKAQHQTEYRELLNAQITEIAALRKKYVERGDAQKAADAARVLAELRRLTDFQPPKEKKKRFVEAIVNAKPATVDMMLLKSARLKESANKEQGRWARVPNALVGASIFASPPTGANGTADFKVTKGGQIYLALNYDYQGSGSGGWTEERWMPEDFMAAGWAQVRGMQMVAWNNRTYFIFTRKAEKGEQFRLRCNKYEPPYVILLDGGKAATTTREAAPDAPGLFKDHKLEAAVRKALGKPVGDITPRDLASLEKLEASFLGITDITGLEHATNLTSLNLSHNPISNITPLGGLTKLKRLLLYKNRITDLKPLAALTNVEFVTFWETNVSDLTPLKGWKNLKSIELRLTKVTDYSPLHGLTNLKSLATNRRLVSDEQLAMLKQALPNCKIEIEKRGPQSQ